MQANLTKWGFAIALIVVSQIWIACSDEKSEPKQTKCATQSLTTADNKNLIVWQYNSDNQPIARIGYNALGARTDCTLISYTSSPAFINFTVFDNQSSTVKTVGAAMGNFGPTRRVEQYSQNGISISDTIISTYDAVGQLASETISRRTLPSGGPASVAKYYYRYTWSGGNLVSRSYSGPEIRRFPATYPDGFTYQTYEYWPQNANATDTFCLYKVKDRNLLKRVLGDASTNFLTTEYTYRFQGTNTLIGATELKFTDRARPLINRSFNFNKTCR